MCRVALLVTGTAMLVILFANVVARYALHSGGFAFAQELPERLFPWFIAAWVALAAQHGGHMSVEWLLERSGLSRRRFCARADSFLSIPASARV